jgi:hypothetical protein
MNTSRKTCGEIANLCLYSSLRGAKRRSNPRLLSFPLRDGLLSLALAMTIVLLFEN